ncbi:polysaccharide biosynthesis/export family protein [Paraglaciecola polaris]|uniref:Polysaccharide export outer membrane protein n=1 Tax=Paraglaciecola polaris LMG 21857 TaxID=1129793 RepID=K7AA46_9ALTE|nr:polysaccharide biosynthesis/export family protein [Paraglaciecola polaris]GAC32270.1 polysaccharide export outer membrane protein [Paraglaciecola polaris LMG 21857]
MKAKTVLWLWLVLFSSAAWSLDASLSQYKLGSGDVIKVTVFGQPDLSLTTKLPNHGVINYPFLGDLSVIGLTGAELEAKLYAGLKGDYLIEPSVSVTVIDYRPFFIDGEVKRPGGYPYQPGLSVDKAAALAGGYTERASKTKIFIRRENESGQQEQLSARSTDVVLPGDIVTVQQSFF